MKKFAVIQMGEHYDPSKHQALFKTKDMEVHIRTVRDFKEGLSCLDELVAEGIKCVELCGAFGEERAREMIAHTEGKIAIGYVTIFKEQETMFREFFE